jgi:L-threonylcarbamoyladenylate synthase
VRVSAHPLVQALCNAFGGAIVSTSANPAGKRPARNPLRVLRALGSAVDCCLHDELGGAERPTVIRNLLSGEMVRSG